MWRKNECYAGPIGYSLDEFVRIIVIDGCFIIELFRKIAYKELREKNDLIFTESCMLSFLLHDLILLENQVPWMVMDCLFNMTMDPTRNEPLIELVKTFLHTFFFTELLYGYPPITNRKHIVDVCRKLLVSSITGEKGQLDWTLPSAMRLVEAGVKIKNGESKSFLDIKYENSVLEIPPLGIEETTETLFQNIISFEQCCPDCELRFTSYTILLDNLINTSKDMDILYKNKVIDSWLNPYDVVPFFNNTHLKKEIYYQKLCKDVNEYCNRGPGGLDGMLSLCVIILTLNGLFFQLRPLPSYFSSPFYKFGTPSIKKQEFGNINFLFYCTLTNNHSSNAWDALFIVPFASISNDSYHFCFSSLQNEKFDIIELNSITALQFYLNEKEGGE